MQVIPAINAPDFELAQDLIKKVAGFSGWIHIDVGDGKFSSIKTWGDSKEISNFGFRRLGRASPLAGISDLGIEIHLMVVDPLNHVEDWLKAGAKRLIVHLEAVHEHDVDNILKLCQKYGADLMLAINPQTPVEQLRPYFNKVNFFQVLAVDPGKAGQNFQPLVLDKIKFLRQEAPSAKIEVDGGINPETAAAAKKAGADIAISASYIFSSDNPEEAFRELENI